jgi:hypothetical protein
MAVVSDLIDAAFNRSLKARPAQFSESAELLAIVKRSVLECFIAASAVNPKYFGKRATVAFTGGVWAIPADSLTVFRIENPGGDRVVEVPLHDREADLGQPAVYRLGGSFFGAGNPLDPASGNLTMFHARTPVQPANVAASTDSSLAADWDEIHVLALYIHMIGKDAANHPTGEAERQSAERAAWLEQFREHVRISTSTNVNRMGNGT